MALAEVPFEEPADEAAPRIDPAARRINILDPGFDLTLRPMRYPEFYEMYRDAIKNTWTVDEIDFSDDLVDLDRKLLPAEKHLINRLVAFFATGDSIVSNNLVLNLYQHINAPEARMYLSRQLYEEALHVQFYLTLLDNYIPDMAEREAAFAYVYFLRSKGLLNGLAAGTNWVFRDESCHMNFAFEVINTVRSEQPELFDEELGSQIYAMMDEAIECEYRFAEDLRGQGVPGMSTADTRQYLQFVADQRLAQLGLDRVYNVKNPFGFMELQDVQELTNFFERTVAAYQTGVEGAVAFDEEF